ncbi:MAG: hypothetical protein BZ138_04385 [Methanosphaera sp. rholeuAM270]|nr:MAG: hypothetical protein BZ138_04385 [Methanosphaera sp. rholeuAM270]
MMDDSDFFKFEDGKMDFPFYNGKPYLSTNSWIILLASIILFILLLNFPINFIPENLHGFIYFFVMLIPFIIATHGQLGTIFKKPKLKDIKTIIICLVLGFLLSMLFVKCLNLLGIPTVDNPITSVNHDLLFYITLLVQLMGEELLKIVALLILMFVTYKYTENRKTSLCIAFFITLCLFGLLHTRTYGGNVLHALFVIGFGSFFDVYAYVKTKNILVSYAVHVLTDLLGLFLSFAGASAIVLLI